MFQTQGRRTWYITILRKYFLKGGNYLSGSLDEIVRSLSPG